MYKEDFRIVFMGTPDFAVAILEELLNQDFNIVGVITAPDKPAGRGQQLHESAVKKFASQKKLNILQPTNLKEESFISELKDLKADLFVVVAFRMLPEIVWAMPPKGTINLHASLLPNYRGAAPINWAIINGEKETGVTTFFIEKEIDTGKIIEQQRVTIGKNETVGELHDRLMELGAKVTASTVDKIMKGDIEGIDQTSLIKGEPKHAPKIFKPDGEIFFNRPVKSVHNKIRGFSPYPGAWCLLENKSKNETKSFKIFNSEATDIPVADDVHFVLKNSSDGILFPCSDHYLLIKEIQPEGKRKMFWKEFLAGNQLDEWKIVK